MDGKTCKAPSLTSLTGLCGTEVHQAGRRVLLTTTPLELPKVIHLSTTREITWGFKDLSLWLTLWVLKLLTFPCLWLAIFVFPGVYAYTEASDPRKRNERAILISPLVRANRVCVDFWYHMYGQNMGWLRVFYRNPVSRRERRLWYKSKNQNNEWHNERLAISSYFSYQVKSIALWPCAKRWASLGEAGKRGRVRARGGGTPIWNRQGCSSEILNLTPKGDHLGVAQAFCDPWRRPIWAWLKQILTPKRDRLKTQKYDMQWVLMI